MAVLVLGNFYNKGVLSFLKYAITISTYVIVRNMHAFIAYITAYSIMITCNIFFTDVTWKFHINISKLINRM